MATPDAPLAPAIPAGWTRETRIRRDSRGRWFDGDEPIGHSGIEKAFDRWIDRADDGRYVLKNSVNWAYVAIEGAPLFVRQLVLDEGGASLVLSDQKVERLDASSLRQDAEGRIYCSARGGTMTAAFDRSAALQLGAALESDDTVVIGGAKFKVPVVADPIR